MILDFQKIPGVFLIYESLNLILEGIEDCQNL